MEMNPSRPELLFDNGAVWTAFFISSIWHLVWILALEIRLMWNVFPACDDAAAGAAADKEFTHEAEMVRETHGNENVSDEEVTVEEVTMVMERLGTPYDPYGRKLQDKMGPKDVTAMFDEQEPSLDEVKEAFCIFDKNNDGYIDAKELRLVLSMIFAREFKEKECREMIRPHDENGDGLIDIIEFHRLVANSFS